MMSDRTPQPKLATTRGVVCRNRKAKDVSDDLTVRRCSSRAPLGTIAHHIGLGSADIYVPGVFRTKFMNNPG